MKLRMPNNQRSQLPLLSEVIINCSSAEKLTLHLRKRAQNARAANCFYRRTKCLLGIHSIFTFCLKRRMCFETGLCLVFYPVQNIHFLMSSESLVICKRPKSASFWQLLVHFCVVYCEVFETLGSKMA